jgi:hypothetical protein
MLSRAFLNVDAPSLRNKVDSDKWGWLASLDHFTSKSLSRKSTRTLPSVFQLNYNVATIFLNKQWRKNDGKLHSL